MLTNLGAMTAKSGLLRQAPKRSQLIFGEIDLGQFWRKFGWILIGEFWRELGQCSANLAAVGVCSVKFRRSSSRAISADMRAEIFPNKDSSSYAGLKVTPPKFALAAPRGMRKQIRRHRETSRMPPPPNLGCLQTSSPRRTQGVPSV